MSTDRAACADVSIVSNSRLLREGIASLLATYTDICLVDSYSGEVSPATRIANPPEHVVLIDAGIGQDLAVAWTRHWHTHIPPAHVVILELKNNTDTIIACIEAGAAGYTLQGAALLEVVDTIHRVQRGLVQCSREIITQLLARPTPVETSMPVVSLRIPLTLRELDVLCCLTDGDNNREIADRLVIEVHTVKYHVHNILEKLKVAHRWDAARLAQEQGWIERCRVIKRGRE